MSIPKPADYPKYNPEDDAANVWGGRRCIAWSRQNGRRCKMPALVGRKVCRMHGGKSLAGFAHPGLKDGWYSKDFLASFRTKRIRQDAKDIARFRRKMKTLYRP